MNASLYKAERLLKKACEIFSLTTLFISTNLSPLSSYSYENHKAIISCKLCKVLSKRLRTIELLSNFVPINLGEKSDSIPRYFMEIRFK